MRLASPSTAVIPLVARRRRLAVARRSLLHSLAFQHHRLHPRELQVAAAQSPAASTSAIPLRPTGCSATAFPAPVPCPRRAPVHLVISSSTITILIPTRIILA